MSWEPKGLWDLLEDKVINNYEWKKEERDFALCYTCYHKDKVSQYKSILLKIATDLKINSNDVHHYIMGWE